MIALLINAVLSTILVGVLFLANSYKTNELDYVETDSLSHSIVIYHNALNTYREKNPAVVGVVYIDSELPSWFTPNSKIKNFIAHESIFTYCECSPYVANKLLELSKNSTLVGIAENGKLKSPLFVNYTINLPSVIKNGAVVYGG